MAKNHENAQDATAQREAFYKKVTYAFVLGLCISLAGLVWLGQDIEPKFIGWIFLSFTTIILTGIFIAVIFFDNFEKIVDDISENTPPLSTEIRANQLVQIRSRVRPPFKPKLRIVTDKQHPTFRKSRKHIK